MTNWTKRTNCNRLQGCKFYNWFQKLKNYYHCFDFDFHDNAHILWTLTHNMKQFLIYIHYWLKFVDVLPSFLVPLYFFFSSVGPFPASPPRSVGPCPSPPRSVGSCPASPPCSVGSCPSPPCSVGSCPSPPRSVGCCPSSSSLLSLPFFVFLLPSSLPVLFLSNGFLSSHCFSSSLPFFSRNGDRCWRKNSEKLLEMKCSVVCGSFSCYSHTSSQSNISVVEFPQGTL